MPVSEFQINSTPAPAYARPTGPQSRLIYPAATDLDVAGAPCGAVGPIEAVIGRAVISAAGHAWYMAHFTTGTELSVALTDVTIWDDLTEAWHTFTTATLHRPTWAEANPGAWYKGYQIRITGMED